MRATLVLLALAVSALAGRASAQAGCPRVLAGFEPPGANGDVTCFCTFDDGNGPGLYVGGRFGAIGTVGSANVARFDGAAWTSLGAGAGSGSPSHVADMVVFEFHAGPRLVAGGNLAVLQSAVGHVKAWDGTSWTAVGANFNEGVRALVVFDDGAGPRLYAGGSFWAPTLHVARFDGTDWVPVGAGLAGVVEDLIVHDDGTGPALYAGGAMFGGGNQPGVRKWTGTSWNPVGTALDGRVNGLASYDDGSGGRLYAAIGLQGEPIQGVRRWNGTSWETVGTIGAGVRSLSGIDLLDGHGFGLYAAGDFTGGVARWNGTAWSDVATGPVVEAFAVEPFDVAGQRRLFAAMTMHTDSTLVARGLTRLDGASWIPVQSGRGLVTLATQYSGFPVNALAQHDFGTGSQVLAAGTRFSAQPGLVDASIARWDGAEWTALPMNASIANEPILAIESFDLGFGPELIAGTTDSGAWRWTGSGWSQLPGGTTPFTAVNDFLVFDLGAGPLLAAAGRGRRPDGVQHAQVQVWNGSAWTQIGTNLASWAADALAVFDDGGGPQLYCAGRFSSMNGVPGTAGIARWNGTTWSSVGGGLPSSGPGADGEIFALLVHDDGSGPALHVGGWFSEIGGAPIAHLARWSSAGWSTVGTGVPSNAVFALASHDDGSGPRLWAGGEFTSIAGLPANRIAVWDGVAWSTVGGGAAQTVRALSSFDEGTGWPRTLWAAGRFSAIAGRASSYVARIGCAPDTGFPFCFGDTAHGPTACPCANAGATGHGCASAASPAGAILSATGSTTPTGPGGADSVVLACDALPATTSALFLQGALRIPAVPFGDGLRCAAGATIRLATKTASAGSAQFPAAGDPPLSQRGMTPPGSALTRHYQVWYRTAQPVCTSATFNLSSALTITW